MSILKGTMTTLRSFLISQYSEPDHYRGDDVTKSNSVTYRELQNELITLHRDKMHQIDPSKYPLNEFGLDAAGMDFVDLSLSTSLEWVVASVLHGIKPEDVREEEWNPSKEADYVRNGTGRYEIINHPSLESELKSIGHLAETHWKNFSSVCAWYAGERDNLNHSEDVKEFEKYRIHLEALYATVLDRVSSNSREKQGVLQQRGLIRAA